MASARPPRLWLALRIGLAGMVPLAMVAVLIVGVLLPQRRADLDTGYQGLAGALAAQVETHLLGAERQLRAIAEDFRSHPGDHSAPNWSRTLDAHAGTGDGFAAIYLADPDGSAYAVGLPRAERGRRRDLVHLDLSERAALREARQQNEEVWSAAFLSTVTGRLAVSVAIPLSEQVLVGQIALDRLALLLGRSPAESAMHTIILDAQGQIIAHSAGVQSGAPFSVDHLPGIRDALLGHRTTQDFAVDGEMFVGTSVSIPRFGWILLVAQPHSDTLRPFLSTAGVLAAGALAALLLTVVMALTMARSLARPIGRYAEQAHAIAGGDYSQPWPVYRIREFDRLAGDLERMALAIRQREQELAKSEARYRSVIASAPLAIFQFDERGVFALSEGKGLARVGLVAGEAVGQSLFELYRGYPELCDYARRAISGEPLHFVSRFGDTWFDTCFTPVRDAAGCLHVMGVAVDISERLHAEKALRESEARLRTAIESIPFDLFLIGPDGRYVLQNTACRKAWGDVLGKYPGDVTDDTAILARWDDNNKRALAGEIVEEDVRLTVGNEERYLHNIIAPIKDGDDIRGILGINIDITERKRSAELLELMRLSVEYGSDAIFWMNRDGSIAYVNEQACRSLGYVRADLLQLRLWEVDPNYSTDTWDEAWRALTETGSFHAETRHRRHDGSEFPVEVNAIAITYEGRTYAIGFACDITERKRDHEILKRSETDLQLAVEVAGLGHWKWDIRTGELIWSERCKALYGLPPDTELTYERFLARVHPDDRARVDALLREALEKRGGYELEKRLVWPDGSVRWTSSMGRVICDSDDQPVLMVGVTLDITERKQAEDALRLTQFTVDRTADAVFLIDAESRFKYVNEAACVALDYTREELTSMSIPDIDPDVSDQMASDIFQDLKRQGSLRFETRHRRKDGTTFPVEVNANYIAFSGEELNSCFVRNITERKRAEDELERHQEHLEELVTERTAELRQAMEQLVQAEKLAALGHLVAGMAHELNTPLGNARVVASSLGAEVRNFAAAVDAGALRRSQVATFLERSREAVELLERNAARAADLISNFKQVAVDQVSARRRRFDLRQTVEELLVTLQPQLKRTAHRIELDIPRELELDSYPGPLEQVLANLVGNSLTHGFAGIEAGLIRVRAAPLDGDRVQIDYTDDGVGIPDGLLHRIFEPFFTTRLGQGGSGLGLYIVYNLVTGVLGGTIRGFSDVGKGVAFVLILPRIASERTLQTDTHEQ